MVEYSIDEEKTNVSKDENDGREGLFGSGKDLFKIPESIDETFDDIDISKEFEGDVL